MITMIMITTIMIMGTTMGMGTLTGMDIITTSRGTWAGRSPSAWR